MGHLNCLHLTLLDLDAALGLLKRPVRANPLLDLLRERGQRHEDSYVGHLAGKGHSIARIRGAEFNTEAIAATADAMRQCMDIIVQAALQNGRWSAGPAF